MTDRLTVVEHMAPRCASQIDVTLAALDERQRQVCLLFNRLSRRSDPVRGSVVDGSPDEEGMPERIDPSGGAARDDDQAIDEQLLWVPVASLSRQASHPVDITNESGIRLPRLTQLEVAVPVAAGMHQLLRGILASKPEARTDSAVSRYLYHDHHARWLMQSVLQRLLTARNPPVRRARPLPEQQPSTDDAGAVNWSSSRDLAQRILEEDDRDLTKFYGLLGYALHDYLLVVGLPAQQQEHLLTYPVPLVVGGLNEVRPLSGVKAQAKGLGTRLRKSYVATFTTQVPSRLKSYHLVAETDPALEISSMTLTSESRKPFAERVEGDLEYLLTRIKEPRLVEYQRRILNNELNKVLVELSELADSRAWDLRRFSLVDDADNLPRGIATLLRTDVHALSPEREMQASTGTIDHLQERRDALTEVVGEGGELERLALATDYHEENDPEASAAHIYWRRRGARRDSSAERTPMTVTLSITDATSTNPRTVGLFVLAILGMSAVAAAFLTASVKPGSEDFSIAGLNDALAAILIVVPGLMYSRLDLPRRASVASYVGTLPRLCAYWALAIALVQALAVATDFEGGMYVVFPAGWAGLILAIVVLWVQHHRSGGSKRPPVGRPGWAGGPGRPVTPAMTAQVSGTPGAVPNRDRYR